MVFYCSRGEASGQKFIFNKNSSLQMLRPILGEKTIHDYFFTCYDQSLDADSLYRFITQRKVEKKVMKERNRKSSVQLLHWIISFVLASLLGCQPAPQSTDFFDDDPDTVVFYYNIHYPGIPRPTQRPTDRYCMLTPKVRIWGDGLVFYDEKIIIDRNSIYSGILSSQTFHQVYDILASAQFFSEREITKTHFPPVPSGTFEEYGGKARSQPAVHYGSDQGVVPVSKIINLVKPGLAKITNQNQVDSRIEQIMAEYATCNLY